MQYLDGVDSMLRGTRFTQESLAEENLGDHQISLYLGMLSNKIPTARRVTFINNLNLFNLLGNNQ